MSEVARHLHVIAGFFSSSLLLIKFFECFFSCIVYGVRYSFI